MSADHKSLIKDCIDKVCETDKAKHLLYRKLGIPYSTEKCPHALITLQIDENKTTDREKEEISDFASLLSSYKWFKNNIYHFSLEYFSKEYPEGGNLHFHYLIKNTNYQLCKTKIIRDCKSKFSHCIKTCNYQSSNSLEHYNNRLNYIQGSKRKHEKLVFSERDCVWRTQNNISPYYTNATE